jgi:hypothetical protein
VQIIQMHLIDVGGEKREFPWGATLVIDVSGGVRFVIRAPAIKSRSAEMEQMMKLATTNALGWNLNDPAADPFAVDYRGMHEVRT